MCECDKKSSGVIGSLDDSREKKVFNIISEGPVNFTTIKNKSSLHQEITSRVLKRLSDKLLVRKTKKTYDLCCDGTKLKLEKV